MLNISETAPEPSRLGLAEPAVALQPVVLVQRETSSPSAFKEVEVEEKLVFAHLPCLPRLDQMQQ